MVLASAYALQAAVRGNAKGPQGELHGQLVAALSQAVDAERTFPDSLHILNDVPRRVEEGGFLGVFGPAVGNDLISASRVILVADRHSNPLCRTALGRLLQELRPKIRPTALFVECVSEDRQDALNRALATGDEEIVDSVIRERWFWPTRVLSRELIKAHIRGIEIHAAGHESPAETQTSPWLINSLVAEQVDGWLRDDCSDVEPLRQAVIFYGGAHLSRHVGSIPSVLQDLNHDLIVLWPVSEVLELAILRQLGATGSVSWVRLAPHVYRPPWISSEEWLDAIGAERSE